ncbi:hypothetical protein ACJX0J_035393, partial [Zea mays]
MVASKEPASLEAAAAAAFAIHQHHYLKCVWTSFAAPSPRVAAITIAAASSAVTFRVLTPQTGWNIPFPCFTGFHAIIDKQTIIKFFQWIKILIKKWAQTREASTIIRL